MPFLCRFYWLFATTTGSKICTSSTTGNASVVVTGGVSPYTYKWSNDTTNTTTLSNLSAGNYCVTVTDNAVGCSKTACFKVGMYAPLTGRVEVTNIAGTDEYIYKAIVGSGVPPYKYKWSNGDTLVQTRGHGPDEMCVQIVDFPNRKPRTIDICKTAVNCTNLVFSATEIRPTCAGQQNGSIALTGNIGLTFTWADGSTSAIRNNLTAGAYAVTVAEGKDCKQTTTHHH